MCAGENGADYPDYLVLIKVRCSTVPVVLKLHGSVIALHQGVTSALSTRSVKSFVVAALGLDRTERAGACTRKKNVQGDWPALKTKIQRAELARIAALADQLAVTTQQKIVAPQKSVRSDLMAGLVVLPNEILQRSVAAKADCSAVAPV